MWDGRYGVQLPAGARDSFRLLRKVQTKPPYFSVYYLRSVNWTMTLKCPLTSTWILSFRLRVALSLLQSRLMPSFHPHLHEGPNMLGKGKGVKVKQSLCKSLGLQKFETPRFQDSWHVKVVRLSVLCTGRLYSSGNIPGTHFC